MGMFDPPEPRYDEFEEPDPTSPCRHCGERFDREADLDEDGYCSDLCRALECDDALAASDTPMTGSGTEPQK